jgi:hypothetical protein
MRGWPSGYLSSLRVVEIACQDGYLELPHLDAYNRMATSIASDPWSNIFGGLKFPQEISPPDSEVIISEPSKFYMGTQMLDS